MTDTISLSPVQPCGPPGRSGRRRCRTRRTKYTLSSPLQRPGSSSHLHSRRQTNRPKDGRTPNHEIPTQKANFSILQGPPNNPTSFPNTTSRTKSRSSRFRTIVSDHSIDAMNAFESSSECVLLCVDFFQRVAGAHATQPAAVLLALAGAEVLGDGVEGFLLLSAGVTDFGQGAEEGEGVEEDSVDGEGDGVVLDTVDVGVETAPAEVVVEGFVLAGGADEETSYVIWIWGVPDEIPEVVISMDVCVFLTVAICDSYLSVMAVFA